VREELVAAAPYVLYGDAHDEGRRAAIRGSDGRQLRLPAILPLAEDQRVRRL
jgi:hypothetical protein